MASLKDTTVEGQIAVSDPPTVDAHVVRNNDARLSDARPPLSHTHTKSQITDLGSAAGLNVPAGGGAAASNSEVVRGDDPRNTNARPPTTHTHTKSQITDLGSAAGLNVPASGGAAASGSEVVRGDDPRMVDARTPLTHSHANATESVAGFMSADDKTILDGLAGSSGGIAPRHGETFGDAAATSFLFTHTLGTEDVVVQVRKASSPKEVIDCLIEIVSSGSVRLTFAAPPAANAFRVVIL